MNGRINVMQKINNFIFVSILLLISLFVFFFVPRNKHQVFEVKLGENGFVPNQLTVQKGDSVRFTSSLNTPFWPASDPHPLHTIFPQFDPKKPISPTGSWTFKTTKIGEWNYHDHLFPSYKAKLFVISKKNWILRNTVLKREELNKMVESLGPEKTYQNLKKIYDQSSASTHITFHLLGEVMYTKFGIEGVNYCDNYAGFGCYHGFFIKAVSDKGLGVATQLDEKCVEIFGLNGLGCPHGIGHGLVEYFGLGKIKEALSICAKLSWKGPLFGCSGGVFMENNFPTVFDKNGSSNVVIRGVGNNLFEPCAGLDSKFRQSCYFEQTSWWNQVLGSDYDKVGKLCSSLKIVKERESCLLGMGNSIAESSLYNTNTVINGCSKLQNKNSEAICRAGGAWAFFSNPEKREQSQDVCAGLGLYEKLCLDKRILVK
ncbi:MAG TPA: hypothetical protein VFI61_00235 [Patescibacteria group bacterium]|nr:hypothetical protein [Patescibacteria group bacterium]